MKKAFFRIPLLSIGVLLLAGMFWYQRDIPFREAAAGVDWSGSHRVYLAMRDFSADAEILESYSLSAWSGTEEYDSIMAYLDGLTCRRQLKTLLPMDSVSYLSDELPVEFTAIDANHPAGNASLTFTQEGEMILTHNSLGQGYQFFAVSENPRAALEAYVIAHGEKTLTPG